jgi:hypothetical protein
MAEKQTFVTDDFDPAGASYRAEAYQRTGDNPAVSP